MNRYRHPFPGVLGRLLGSLANSFRDARQSHYPARLRHAPAGDVFQTETVSAIALPIALSEVQPLEPVGEVTCPLLRQLGANRENGKNRARSLTTRL